MYPAADYHQHKDELDWKGKQKRNCDVYPLQHEPFRNYFCFFFLFRYIIFIYAEIKHKHIHLRLTFYSYVIRFILTQLIQIKDICCCCYLRMASIRSRHTVHISPFMANKINDFTLKVEKKIHWLFVLFSSMSVRLADE